MSNTTHEAAMFHFHSTPPLPDYRPHRPIPLDEPFFPADDLDLPEPEPQTPEPFEYTPTPPVILH